ncbi:MAG TPA: hypothetical protein VMC41_04655 [Candidatus Nanoarchaeia archaeon]|nr:hypothetical protein [Candidatus Nanoarchaeia archaeon]
MNGEEEEKRKMAIHELSQHVPVYCNKVLDSSKLNRGFGVSSGDNLMNYSSYDLERMADSVKRNQP